VLVKAVEHLAHLMLESPAGDHLFPRLPREGDLVYRTPSLNESHHGRVSVSLHRNPVDYVPPVGEVFLSFLPHFPELIGDPRLPLLEYLARSRIAVASLIAVQDRLVGELELPRLNGGEFWSQLPFTVVTDSPPSAFLSFQSVVSIVIIVIDPGNTQL